MRFLDVSEEINLRVLFLVRVAKLHVLSQWLQLELRTPYHGIWLPLNHWLDRASGCISTLGIQRGVEYVYLIGSSSMRCK